MKKIIFAFLFLAFVGTSFGQVVYSKTQVAGTATAAMTITKIATLNTFTARIVVTGTFGLYGNFQGPFFVNGPSFFCDRAGVYDYTIVTNGAAQTNGYFGGQQQSGGPYTPSNAAIIIPAWATPVDTPQTITVSPNPLSPVRPTETFTLTASGSNTGYVWTLSGGGTISGAGNTRAFTAGNTDGTFHLIVYAPAASGFARSADVDVPIGVFKSITVRVAADNRNSPVIRSWLIYKNGVLVQSGEEHPGVLGYFSIPDVKTTDVITVEIRVPGVKKNANGIIETGNMDPAAGPIDYMVSANYTVDHSNTPTGVMEVTTPPSQTDPSNIVKPPTPDGKKSVWDPTTGTAPVTDGLYQQGTDKLVAGLNDLNATLKGGLNVNVTSGGTGGGTGSDEGTHSRLDTANTHLQKIASLVPTDPTNAAAGNNAAAIGANAAADVEAANSRAAAMGQGIAGTALFAGVSTVAVSPMSADNGFASQPQYLSTTDNSLLVRMFGTQLDVNPFSSSALGKITQGKTGVFLAWIRNFIAWALIVGFVKWTLDKVLETCRSIGQVSPLQLSPSSQIVVQTSVVGNSVGVPFAAGMWALQLIAITTGILAAPSIIVAAIYTTGEFSSLFPSGSTAAQVAANGSAGGGWIANMLSYSYLILPVTVMITISINTLFIRLTNIVQTLVITIGLKLASAI